LSNQGVTSLRLVPGCGAFSEAPFIIQEKVTEFKWN